MEKKLYTCQFCKKEFEPARRKIQKFCSNSCRSKNHHHKNKVASLNAPKINLSQQLEEINNKKNKVEQMSWAGFGNAALGSIVADATVAVTNYLTGNAENKPATKGDLEKLEKLISTQYFEVHNISPDMYGRRAYFDMASSKIVYYNEHLQRYELPLMNL